MKTILTIAGILMIAIAFSQQEAQFGQYYNNPYAINPAAGGMSKVISVDLGYRRQWLGIEGTPQTLYASAHSEISFDRRNTVLDKFNTREEPFYQSPDNAIGVGKHVVGGKMLGDQIGPFRRANVMMSYAYHLRFTEKTMLSFGVGAGITNMGILSNKVILLDTEDADYDQFLARNANQTIFDMNAGIAFYGENFQLGVSSNQLLRNEVKLSKTSTQSYFGRHWFMYGMYDFKLGEESKISIEPHFLGQIVGKAPFSFTVGTRVHFDQRYWANVSYRVQDAILVGAGLNFGRFLSLGYSYDLAVGKVQKPTNYVHELHLGFVIGHRGGGKNGQHDEEN